MPRRSRKRSRSRSRSRSRRRSRSRSRRRSRRRSRSRSRRRSRRRASTPTRKDLNQGDTIRVVHENPKWNGAIGTIYNFDGGRVNVDFTKLTPSLEVKYGSLPFKKVRLVKKRTRTRSSSKSKSRSKSKSKSKSKPKSRSKSKSKSKSTSSPPPPRITTSTPPTTSTLPSDPERVPVYPQSYRGKDWRPMYGSKDEIVMDDAKYWPEGRSPGTYLDELGSLATQPDLPPRNTRLPWWRTRAPPALPPDAMLRNPPPCNVPSLSVIRRALSNSSGKNVWLAMHIVMRGYMRYSDDTNPSKVAPQKAKSSRDRRNVEESFATNHRALTTKIPEGIMLVYFTPQSCLMMGADKDVVLAQSMRDLGFMLRGNLAPFVRVYFPGDMAHNHIVTFDEFKEFDAYRIPKSRSATVMKKLDPVTDSKQSANDGRKVSRLRKEWTNFFKYAPGPAYQLRELLRHPSIRNPSGPLRVVFMAGCAEEWSRWPDYLESARSENDQKLVRDIYEAQRITLRANNRGSYCRDQIVAMARAAGETGGATGKELRGAFSTYVKAVRREETRPVRPFEDTLFDTDARIEWDPPVYANDPHLLRGITG